MKQAEKATNNNATRNKNKSAADVKNSKEYETLRDMARDFAAKDYEELEDIKQDLDSLRSNVVQLTRHLKHDGAAKAADVKERLKDGMGELRAKSEERLHDLEEKVRENPRNSILLAFGAGVLANILLRRR